MEPKLDCKFYLGEKPCKFKRLCDGCREYSPFGTQILIIKLGAIGDALRTTPILHALKRAHPVSTITWITDTASYPILKHNALIDRLIDIASDDVNPLYVMEFDFLLSFEKSPQATALAMQINAGVRRGFALSPWGTLDIFNDASSYSLALGLDDDLKFRENDRTYQEIIYEMAEYPYARDPYIFNLSSRAKQAAKTILESDPLKQTGPKIGLNIGCGDVFASKKWPDQHFIALARLVQNEMNACIYLLGGQREVRSIRQIRAELDGTAVDTGVNALDIFTGVINEMDIVVTSDTLALHLALAVKTKTVALFGPTCRSEIDFYDMGIAIESKTDCTPCYLSSCEQTVSCMDEIMPRQVMDSVRILWENS